MPPALTLPPTAQAACNGVGQVRRKEPRRKVLIEARLRDGTDWDSVHITDVSPRGLGMRAPRAPQRGSYIEVCRGPHRIIARVVWAERESFGVQAQDVIAFDAIAASAEAAPQPANDRRLKPREPSLDEQEQGSRRWSRRLEFAALTLFACSAAFLAFETISETLSRPLDLVAARLTGSG